MRWIIIWGHVVLNNIVNISKLRVFRGIPTLLKPDSPIATLVNLENKQGHGSKQRSSHLLNL